MINEIITKLLINSDCKFKITEQISRDFYFYRSTSPNYKRFLVVVKVDGLIKPNAFNQWILANTPDEIKESPGFSKNTDVVVLFKLDSLTDIIKYEKQVFSLEEDSYSFKKHVLYYSQTELELLDGMNTNSITNLIKDQNKFNLYKKTPLADSEYGIISRIFIKFPFLSVPVDESELDDPCILADNNLQDIGLLELSKEFDKLLDSIGSDYQEIVKEYLRGKMEN